MMTLKQKGLPNFSPNISPRGKKKKKPFPSGSAWTKSPQTAQFFTHWAVTVRVEAGALPLNTNSVPPMTLEECTPRL